MAGMLDMALGSPSKLAGSVSKEEGAEDEMDDAHARKIRAIKRFMSASKGGDAEAAAEAFEEAVEACQEYSGGEE